MTGYIETFDSVDDSYLEHFGIRGMHWGSRKSKSWSSQNRPRASDKIPKQSKQKMSTKTKIAVGAAIVGGTLLAAYGGYKISEVIKQNKEKPLSTSDSIKLTISPTPFMPNTTSINKSKSFSSYAQSGTNALKKTSVVDDYTKELLRRGRI